MKIFTVGPTEMYDEIKSEGGKQTPYFRTEEFSQLMLDTDIMLKKFLKTSNESKVIYLTASGTGAMEATIINCLRDDDKILIINGGTFGARFRQLCDIHSLKYTEIILAEDEELKEEHLNKYNNAGYSTLLVNLHETSTGQLYDVKLLARFCKKNNMYFIVDAISTFLCDPYSMDENNIDVTIISSQKGLCVSPGMAMVALSSRIIRDRIVDNNIRSMYFDFKYYIDNISRGQTPFTPAVGICMQSYKALLMVDKIGLSEYLDSVSKKAKHFRESVKFLPIDIPKVPLSNAITPIIFRIPIAKEVFRILKDEYDIMVNPTGGTNENYMLRIAHIGNNSLEDQEKLVDCIRKILLRYENQLS